MSGLSTLALLASAWLAPTSPPQETVAPPSRKLIVKGAQAKELDALLQRDSRVVERSPHQVSFGLVVSPSTTRVGVLTQ